MSDLINRQDAIETIVKTLSIKGESYLLPGEKKIVEILKKQPTADVRENVHGEWRYGENDIGLDGYWCTACGKFVLWNYNETIDFIHRYNYCPNCGADMRERGEDG